MSNNIYTKTYLNFTNKAAEIEKYRQINEKRIIDLPSKIQEFTSKVGLSKQNNYLYK